MLSWTIAEVSAVRREAASEEQPAVWPIQQHLARRLSAQARRFNTVHVQKDLDTWNASRVSIRLSRDPFVRELRRFHHDHVALHAGAAKEPHQVVQLGDACATAWAMRMNGHHQHVMALRSRNATVARPPLRSRG